jgi:hypothetical protein
MSNFKRRLPTGSLARMIAHSRSFSLMSARFRVDVCAGIRGFPSLARTNAAAWVHELN